jgi:SWI/SNF-related matrix-associated actin-dependent regulator 1 of chromatin subfamily A
MLITDADRIKASFATDTAFQPICPGGLTYLPYQKAGVEYALNTPSCLIADEPGLGKTIQALGLINEINPRRTLIVCPASLRINWRREAAKWLLWADTTIVGYDELVRHPDRTEGRWDLVIYDEAHYMKNLEAKRTRAGLGISAGRRLFLTGTPIVNKPIELYPLLRAIDPKAWGSIHDYGKAYCGARPMKINGRIVWQYDGAANLKELQGRLRSTCMVRRLKKDVLKDLPPKIRQIIEIPAVCSSAGEKMLATVMEIWKSRKQAHTPEAVKALREAQQQAFESLSKIRHEQALAKAPAVVAHIRDLLEQVPKVVVFAHHRDVLLAITESLLQFHPCGVAGGMSDEAKQRAVDGFQCDPEIRVFIGQIQAAGVGLTLTAASVVVFAELDWTPGSMNQCEDRCHRIGQKDSVLVQHLVLERSLDARICKTLVRKQEIIDQTLDSGAVSAELDWVQALAQPEE